MLGNVNWATFVHRTDGASPAFIREMLRKAALFAADESSDCINGTNHPDDQVSEIVVRLGLESTLRPHDRPRTTGLQGCSMTC
jgi:hypothetical protein